MAAGRWLNLELLDSTGKPLAGRGYTLRFDDAALQAGTLNPRGHLHMPVPAGARRCALVVAYRRFELVLDAMPAAATVRGAQERLDHLNFFSGDVDGELGPFTAGALRRFQLAHGLPDTGELDPQTVAVLLEQHRELIRAMEIDRHTPDAVEFAVNLADDPEGELNRIIVYDWFTQHEESPPPRGGNRIEVLVDGEQAWGRVADDLDAATEDVQIATWMCRPDIELRRPAELALAEPSARARHRLGAVLERLAAADVHVRLLIWGMVSTPIVDAWMRRWFWRGHDNIDVLQQDHPNLLGSHHQKTMTIDGRIGYCGGMNLKENDWDTVDHEAWEPRRYPHAAAAGARRETAARRQLPHYPPRHDMIVRLEGPAVGDLLHNFWQRWQQSLAARRERSFARMFDRMLDGLRARLGGEPAPELPEPEREQPVAGDSWAQIVRTTPGGEGGILKAYYRAIYNARRYIYIENQYFRSPDIGLALAQALALNPRLRLVVVVWPVNEGAVSFVDPSGYYTAKTLAAIRTSRPEFELSRLLVVADDADGERSWVPIDVHAKVMIIDDVWVTVGSANINDRGFKTEGEINTVVLDETIATDLRRRLMAEHLGLRSDDPRLADVDQAFDLWDQHGRENPERRAAEREPVSRVHFFVQDAQDRPPFRVGSGIF